MKLGEAKLRLAALEATSDRLEGRITRDSTTGVSLTPIVQELLLITQQIRDLRIVIQWTENTCKVADESLTSYKVKRDALLKLAGIFESSGHLDLRVKADELFTSARNLESVIAMVEWELDAQVPDFLAPVAGEQPKEEK